MRVFLGGLLGDAPIASLTSLLQPFLGHGLEGIYLLLALAAFLKYVAPPVPGDLCLLLGVFYLGLRGGSQGAGVAAIAAGGATGALAAYFWGRRFGRVLHRWKRVSSLCRRVEGILGRWGAWALLANRFVPYVRTLMYPAAGILKIPAGRVAAAAVAGNLLFAVLVVALGYTAGRSFPRLQSLYHLYQFWLGALALALLGALAAVIYRSLAARRIAQE